MNNVQMGESNHANGTPSHNGTISKHVDKINRGNHGSMAKKNREPLQTVDIVFNHCNNGYHGDHVNHGTMGPRNTQPIHRAGRFWRSMKTVDRRVGLLHTQMLHFTHQTFIGERVSSADCAAVC